MRISGRLVSINIILFPGWSTVLPLTPAEILQCWLLGKSARRVQKYLELFLPNSKVILQMAVGPL